jgi:transglutaminase-like putative cysteine protease
MKRAASRRWDFPAAILLLLALLASAERLVATGWTEGLGVTLTLTLLGAALGLALGVSRFRRAGVHLLSLGYSLTMLPWALGIAQYPGMAWQERLASLGGRLGVSFGLFFSAQPVEDPLLFITFAAALFWILSLHAGFALARKAGFLSSVLPAGILLFLIQLYDNWSGARIGLLAFYLFTSLLLLGRLNYSGKRRAWEDQRVWYSAASITDLTIGLTITALVVILLAWVAPSPAQPLAAVKSVWEQVTRPLDQARKDLANAVAGLEEDADAPTADFYNDSLSLGHSGASGDTVLFTVRVPTMLGVARYYWSVRTYDEYQDGQWYSTAAPERSMQPRRPALIIPDASRWPTAEFVFSVPSNRISVLATPLRPVWISRPATLTYLPVSDGVVDPLLVRVDPPIQPGETYTVHAAVANPTVVQLRAAGSDYPAWVTARYLQLPENFPPEIADLAAQITAAAGTPYDKAVAITDYLRANIRYNRTITSSIPEGEDPLAWFLFTSKEGFCNYYASAEVVMLRSVGIPARLAVGFSDGEHKLPDRRIVRQRNAHAWPEVYFPGLGWVEFEPTSYELPLARPPGGTETVYGAGGTGLDPTPQAEDDQTPAGGGVVLPGGEAGEGSGVQTNTMSRLTVAVLLVIAGVAVVGFLVFFGPGEKARRSVYDFAHTPVPVHLAAALGALSLPVPGWLLRWVRWSRLGGVERSFRAVQRGLRWLGAAPDPARTPAQAAAALTGLLPGSASEIRILLDEYQHTLFAMRPGDAHTARRAAEALRASALRAAVQARLNSLRRVFRKGKPK